MRTTWLLVAVLAVGHSNLTAQAFGGTWFDPDTIPVPRIVEEWRSYAGRDDGIHRLVEAILFNPEKPTIAGVV
jgi:hypothetical protein